MADDIPADVQETLVQLLAECSAALEEDDLSTARDTIGSAESVATNKLPDSDLRDHLLHGCQRVAQLLDPDDEDDVEPGAAGEYVAAMRRRLPED